MVVMYRPAPPPQQASIRTTFFSDKNLRTLETVLLQDFEEREGTLAPEAQQRLKKSLQHFCDQVYQKQGDKPVPFLNKEALTICAKDFSQYLQRKQTTQNTNAVKQVMDDGLFQDTSQRFERLTQERNEVKALPSTIPDFRISLTEDGPPAAEMFERAKKQREMEMLRASQQSEMVKAEAGLQGRIMADSNFRAQQDMQNRTTEFALVQRQAVPPRPPMTDMPLVVMPDRRDLLKGAVGSFDSMTASPDPRDLGEANGNPTTVLPALASPLANALPQNNIIREDPIISYREIENNLFLYSADRDWLHNNKENRYNFTVTFDPAAQANGFMPNLATQQKFKNIVRIELVKAIMPGEGLNVTVDTTSTTTNTNYQDNILNFPYVTLRVLELENNNYGTDNYLDRSFGVLQYDAQWVSDSTKQSACNRGFLAMIPKFMKCQKEYYPTPLSTLQKLSIQLLRPNGEPISATPDTYDIAGIIAPQAAPFVYGTTVPFTTDLALSQYNVVVGTNPANLFINTATYFSKFQVCAGDRIQIQGFSYSTDAMNDPTYGSALIAFCQWINRPEGHIVLGSAYQNGINVTDGFNSVGYANYIVIPSRYQDPITGSTALQPFGATFGSTMNAFGIGTQTPVRLINLNKQLNIVFRIITREMDALPQLRPDNNY